MSLDYIHILKSFKLSYYSQIFLFKDTHIGLVVKALDSQSRGSVFKTTGWLQVDSAFHPSEVDKVSTRNFWGLVVKSKLPPRSGSSLEAVEPHP